MSEEFRSLRIWPKTAWLSLIICHLSFSPAGAQLVLNELMQSNIDCVMDDRCDFPDSWVELYNAGTTPVQLSRYSLGVSPLPDEAWPLPSRQVGAKSHLLVCCDKVGSGLHTPFRLETSKGCQVYLFLDGQLADHVEGLPKQPAPNIAYGRQTDGDSLWGYQLTATPAAPNSGGIADANRLLPDPLFSQPGTVSTSSGTVTLNLSMPAGTPAQTEIHYTTDGTEPTAGSPRYTAPLHLSQSTVVRARPFCQGWLSPPSVANSYVFFPRELTLPVVSIATDPRYLDDSAIGIFANNNGQHRHDWRRPVNIEFFFGQDTPAAINQLCETRVSGGASRGAQMKSMAIYAHKRFGRKRFDYEFFPDQCPGLTDFKSLVLRNAGNDFDYLYMRDAIAQLSMGTHADLDFQAWRPAIVYINGQYHGMLNIRERANENYVYTHYDQLEDIDLIENWNSLKHGTWDNFNRFKAFYQEPGHTMDEYEQWMDCTEFMNLMAMNIFFNNVDFPANNIIMWRPRTDGPDGQGRWRWIAKDCDYILGLYQQSPASFNTIEWLYDPAYDARLNWGNSAGATLLFRQLMADDTFRRAFTDRCAVYAGTFLNTRSIRTLWDAMYQTISYEYPHHRRLINQWWPRYDDELQQARSWLSQRHQLFIGQLASFYRLGTPRPLTISTSDADAPQPTITFNGIALDSTAAFNGRYYEGSTLHLEATPSHGRQVSHWHVQTVNAATVTTQQVSGPRLTMVMPPCTIVNITAVTAPEAPSDIATLPTRQPTRWQRSPDGRHLSVSATPGIPIHLYDLRGILIDHAEADASGAATLALPPQGPCVLRVGSSVQKLTFGKAK